MAAGPTGETGASVLRPVKGVCGGEVEPAPIPHHPVEEQTALGRAKKEKNVKANLVPVNVFIKNFKQKTYLPLFFSRQILFDTL